MKRVHIAFVTLLGNGHVYPVLPLCAELVNRGHDVTFVTSDHYSKCVADAGASPIRIKCNPPDKELVSKLQAIDHLDAEDAELWSLFRSNQNYQFEFAVDAVAQIHRFYETNPPNLVLYDPFAPAGRLLAHRLGCPAVRVSPHFAQYETYILRDGSVCKTPLAAMGCHDDLDSFLRSHGIETENNMWYTEDLNIHLIPRKFQYCESHFDNRFCFTGALLNRKFTPSWKNGSGGRPIVLISDFSGLRDSFTSSGTFYMPLIEALSGEGFHCILSVGADLDLPLGPWLPRHFEVNRSASHLEILPSASLLICHGGMLSTLEALYNGVPVLSIPNYIWSDEVAFRTEELGIGRRLRRYNLATDVISEVVREMIADDSLHDRVKQMQSAFRQSDGLQLAVERIERAVSWNA